MKTGYKMNQQIRISCRPVDKAWLPTERAGGGGGGGCGLGAGRGEDMPKAMIRSVLSLGGSGAGG